MKKYSDKFINNTHILKNAIIGFEFEFYMKDMSYYKTLEMINQYLSPLEIFGFKKYHSKFKPNSKQGKIEPDLSGGQGLVELITGPTEYFEAKYYLVKILKFIQEYGYTTDKASIHFNISFNDECDKDLNDLNILKLILCMDEDEIYKNYPSRKNNVYAKTIKQMVPYKEYDFNNIPIDVVKNNLRLPDDKYYGINFLHINAPKEEQRLEYRYIGGKDYEKNIGQILYYLDRFILYTYDTIDVGFNDSDILELEYYLDKNITNFKSFSKYDNFIINFPTIKLQVDQIDDYDVMNAYYDTIYHKIFNLIESANNIKECIINYVTSSQRIEVIDATVSSNMNMKDYDFINCRISDGIFDDCNFVNSDIKNSQLIRSRMDGCDIVSSKILNTRAESSNLKDCYFMNGYLNCDMEGGVFRSGEIGPYAMISSTTKMITDTDNFFNTKFEDDNLENSKGIPKAFKK